MIICNSCGNTGKFIQVRYGQKSYSETAVYNGDQEESSDPVDYVDYEDGDSDETDSDNIKCEACGSSDIEEDLTKKECAIIKAQHTKKDGSWSADELEPAELSNSALALLTIQSMKDRIRGVFKNETE